MPNAERGNSDVDSVSVLNVVECVERIPVKTLV